MRYQGILILLVAVCCMNTRTRLYLSAQVTNRTCACSMGSCNFNQVCTPTPNCTRENVALGKPANMSSFWESNEPSGPACLAVNGNTDTIYRNKNEPNPNCIHTGANDRNAYWLVDLGRKYTIRNITVYIRRETSARINLVSVTVDEQFCYQFSNTPTSQFQIDVTCNPPRRGSIVKFYKNGTGQPEYLLNICEVQVWVCSEGFYGVECKLSCRSNCRDGISCDNYFGTCLSGDACSCSTGCNFTQSCTPAGNCVKDNVALGRPANMSSSWGPDLPSGPACVAVNGNTGTVYRPLVNGEQNPNCIHTGLDDRNAWWLVKLDRNYTVTEITVYIRSDWPQRMDGVVITVDDQVCYKFSSNPQSKTDVSCSPPRKGSVVKFYNNGTGAQQYLLNFCEVQVWVCKPGLYGINCDNKCNCKDDEICDNFYGTCTRVCKNGTYGSNCTNKCGQCKNGNNCNASNGVCLNGCEEGYELPFCKEMCRNGSYGSDCNNTCGSCRDGRPCNASNGVCLDGCLDGFMQPLCKERCNGRFYGSNCTQVCGHCNETSMCDFQTGKCLHGCQSGWREPMCSDCKTGFHGTNCNISCGFCKDSQPCLRENGTCADGCANGFKAPDCIEKCPSGSWGGECKNTCGACLEYACRHDNGTCEKGCIVGHEGRRCEVLSQHDLTGPIVGSVLGAGLIISVAVITAVLIWIRRTSKKENQSPQPKSKVAYDASCEMHSIHDLNFQDDVVDKFKTQEDVARPYTVQRRESYDGNDMHPTALENNYEKLTPQYQNSSADSKPYEVLDVSSK